LEAFSSINCETAYFQSKLGVYFVRRLFVFMHIIGSTFIFNISLPRVDSFNMDKTGTPTRPGR